ncbi:MAG: hypothetical protein ACRYFX_20435 [Janthinobacterium lividum]
MPKLSTHDKALFYLLFRLSPFAPKLQVPAKPSVLRILLIRHGEKPASGDNLSCAGLNRALALPAVLHKLLPAPPDYTFVPLIGTDGKDTTSIRMLQTVMPYAVRHNLTINSDYAADNTAGLAKKLRHSRGTVLVVWEHVNIVEITKKLGIKELLEWPDNDFDSIWTISFSGGGTKGKAKRPVLARSKQHIRPSTTCPGQ